MTACCLAGISEVQMCWHFRIVRTKLESYPWLAIRIMTFRFSLEAMMSGWDSSTCDTWRSRWFAAIGWVTGHTSSAGTRIRASLQSQPCAVAFRFLSWMKQALSNDWEDIVNPQGRAAMALWAMESLGSVSVTSAVARVVDQDSPLNKLIASSVIGW